MIGTLCLGLIHLAGSSITLPPPNIQALIKDRIRHQWQQSGHTPDLRFDDPSCAQQGAYHYTSRSLILIADTKTWRGPLELMLSSVIDGEKIAFERVTPLDLASTPAPTAMSTSLPHGVSSTESQTKWQKWLPWTLGAVGVAAGIYVWRAREQKIQRINQLNVQQSYRF